MSVPQLRDVLELLSELEVVSARLAARRMNDKQRAALQKAIDEGVAALEENDARGFARANVAFHEVICSACHNDYLADQIRSIRRLISRYRPKPFLAPSRREKAIADHQKLAQALLSGDESAAEAAMAEHSPGGDAGFSEFLAAADRILRQRACARPGSRFFVDGTALRGRLTDCAPAPGVPNHMPVPLVRADAPRGFFWGGRLIGWRDAIGIHTGRCVVCIAILRHRVARTSFSRPTSF